MSDSPDQVDELLRAWAGGDIKARDQLMVIVQKELRQLAGYFMKAERPGHTLQPTALVNEALVRFFRQRRIPVEGRSQFIALVSQMMRRVLVDHARKRAAAKRGEGTTLVTLSEEFPTEEDPGLAVLDVERALNRLERVNARQARIVEMRVFGGFEVAQIAEGLGISTATVKRDWSAARAWLTRELSRFG